MFVRAEPWALVASAGDVDVQRRARLGAQLKEAGAGNPSWALVETCHRVELYGVGPVHPVEGMRLLRGEEAVRRLFRVAAGLESAVVGEDEVLHQVREALASARSRGLDGRLVRLFECAIATGRACRALAAPRRGLAERAAAWLSEMSQLRGRQALVVGAGPMGAALAGALRAVGAEVAVASRTPGRAALDLAGAAAAAPTAAAVAVALAGEWSELAAQPEGLPPIADLSSPPAVPEPVRTALGDRFLGIDDLWQRAPGEAGWVARAEALVEEGVRDYLGWLGGRGSLHALLALQERAEARRRARVERLLRRLPHLTQRDRELVEAAFCQLVTDLLHEPVSQLRADADGSGAEAARRLFRL